MPICHCTLMSVYICADRESGWLLPAVWQMYTQTWRHHHHLAGSSLSYVPRRAVLYCPGNDERKLKKLATLDVDCAVLDCEDGVALTKKVNKYSHKTALRVQFCWGGFWTSLNQAGATLQSIKRKLPKEDFLNKHILLHYDCRKPVLPPPPSVI